MNWETGIRINVISAYFLNRRKTIVCFKNLCELPLGFLEGGHNSLSAKTRVLRIFHRWKFNEVLWPKARKLHNTVPIVNTKILAVAL